MVFQQTVGTAKAVPLHLERAFRKTGNEQRQADFQMRLPARAPCQQLVENVILFLRSQKEKIT